MGDYQQTTTISADPATVFAYLSDVSKLPEYFSGMQDARPEGGEDVHVVADVQGQRYEGEAWMHADADAKHMRWGSPGVSGYHGELFVVSIGDTESKVTVELHTEHVDGAAIEAGLEQTLSNLKQALDGTPGTA